MRSIFQGAVKASRPIFPIFTPSNLRLFSSRYIPAKNQRLILALVAVTGAGFAYVVKDYDQAKRGVKKREENTPLKGLDFLYLKMTQYDEEKRQLGLDPAKLFVAAEKSSDLKEKIKWLSLMMTVRATSTEIPLYLQAADILFDLECYPIALQCWETYLSSDRLQEKYQITIDRYFLNNQIEDAVRLSERVLEPHHMPAQYERVGNAWYGQHQWNKAAFFWEKASANGHQPYTMIMRLGHIYLVQEQKELLNKALETFQLLDESKKSDAVLTTEQKAFAYNAMGITCFMTAITNDKPTAFVSLQTESLIYFQKAIALLPNDPVILLNAEIARVLDYTPLFGNPNRHLESRTDQANGLYEAIKKELKQYSYIERTRTEFTSTCVFVPPTYDSNGRRISGGEFITVMVPIFIPYKEPRPANISALGKLESAKMQINSLMKEEKQIDIPKMLDLIVKKPRKAGV